MITPELLEYVKTEIGKGKTREEINRTLISEGGWNADDLSEAFSVPVPDVAGGVGPEGLALNSSTSATGRSATGWQNLTFFILGLFCVISWYFFQPQIVNFWNRGVESSQEVSINSWNAYANLFKEVSFPALKFPSFNLPSFTFKLPSLSLPSLDFGKIFNVPDKAPLTDNNITIPVSKEVGIKNCGVGTAPKLDNLAASQNNSVLSCLGASALNCENATGILKDDFFPTIFEITKLPDACDFKLSYGADSPLIDITGKKLALQHISCPISIVQAIDNTKTSAPQFIAPNKTDLNKYASQIYFYGTLGLFVENNLDKNKIQALGCSGDYIDSIIASYQKMQSER